jgi:DNA-binding transcriptional LysR family regulator
MSQLDLNLLKVFDAIFHRQGITAAAQDLNLSQPAVSHGLAKLRNVLNDQLFVRNGNAMAPTATARALAGPVRNALRSLATAIEDRGNFDPQSSDREFRIGIRLSGEMARFPRIAASVYKHAPNVRLISTTFRRRDLIRSLMDGEIDLAFDVAIPAAKGKLESVILANDSFVVVTRQGHPLMNDKLTLETYLSLEHILASPRPHGPGLEDISLARSDSSRRIAMRCQHFITAWQIVATTDLALTLPAANAGILSTMLPLAISPLPFSLEISKSHLFWHPASSSDPALSWLRTLIIKEYQEQTL